MLTLHELNWEAVATLTTGVLAVAGAIGVAIRQSRILSRQVELEELKLRSDLFDRRFATYEATAHLLTNINKYTEDATRELFGKWLFKYRESQFLFDTETHFALTEIFQKYYQYYVNKEQMAKQHAEDGTYGAGRPEKELELMQWLTRRQTTLHEIFQKDLTLTSL